MISTPQNDTDKKKENEGLKLSNDLLEALAKFQEIELQDFQMDVKDLEIIFEPGMAGQIMPKLKASSGSCRRKTNLHAAGSFPTSSRNLSKQDN